MKLLSIIKNSLIIFFFISFFISCDCEPVNCPALEEEYTNWLPYKTIGVVIKYSDSTGQEIHFTVEGYEASISKSLPCHKIGYGGCKCDLCEPFTYFYSKTLDTSRRFVDATGKTLIVFDELHSSIRESGSGVTLEYSIFDHNNSITLGPVFEIADNDTLLPIFLIGNQAYENVIVHEVDTTAKRPRYWDFYFVWKTYYNKEFGIIGFHDLKTKRFYYRKS